MFPGKLIKSIGLGVAVVAIAASAYPVPGRSGEASKRS
jgi:hypothetical protein